MASFSGNILNIPGLVPVNIGSSSPYAVPFAPQIRPHSAPAPQAAAPIPQPSSLSNVSGFGGDGQTIPSTVNYGDGQDFGFNFGGYGSPSSTPYAPQINPAQSTTSLGGLGLGNLGDGLSDRINSLTKSPYLDSDNGIQALINGLGLFSPAAGLGAGILQGLGLWNGGEPTGNSLADLGATPGALQNGSAWLTNQIWQLFGGTPMTGDPNMAGPPTPDGTPFDGTGQYIPPTVMGPGVNVSPSGPSYQDNMNPGWGGAGSIDTPAQLDNFFTSGGNVLNIGGADIFNSIGLSPWMTPDYGGQNSFGSGGGGFNPLGGNFSADNNGGWGQ